MASLLVVLQFVLLALCFYPWPNSYQMNWGISLIVLASLLGVASLFFNRPGNFNIRPVYKPGGQLIVTGTYAFFRHPMYVAVILSSMGAVAMQQMPLKLLLVFLLFVVLDVKARLEEKAMTTAFPEYVEYQQSGFRWLPFIIKQQSAND